MHHDASFGVRFHKLTFFELKALSGLARKVILQLTQLLRFLSAYPKDLAITFSRLQSRRDHRDTQRRLRFLHRITFRAKPASDCLAVGSATLVHNKSCLNASDLVAWQDHSRATPDIHQHFRRVLIFRRRNPIVHPDSFPPRRDNTRSA